MRRGDYPATRARGVPRVAATDHQRQWPAVHRQGLQGVHSRLRTSPYYPQSHGKIERWHKSLKTECVRRQTPLTLEDSRRAVAGFVSHYNTQRLHSAIGYVTPRDKLEGRAETIHTERDRKLATARESRRRRRRGNGAEGAAPSSSRPEAEHSRQRQGRAPATQRRMRGRVA